MLIRKSKQRGITRTDWLESYHSFSFADYYDPRYRGFSVLRVINQDTIAAAAGFGLHNHHDMEILTYVLRGAIAHRDSLSNETLIGEGELQRMSAGSGISHSEYNPSASTAMELLQIWILPQRKNLTPGYQQTKFPRIENAWQLLASPNGAEGSLLIHQDAKLYRAFVMTNQSLNYESRGRSIWLQVIQGEIQVNGEKLGAGDGCGLNDEKHCQLTAGSAAQVLLFDLP